eukprot:gnl/TRDRNA2_/TRDRNA2_174216_c2_seq1.p1 gnl/TRDRNA2_/TRDRNA2_174216_c2~~gnl/TRDRNA2_/TRDRNA2_174216_c2_seq1.p1  ORF type:complete len:427 (+),score=82.25 gnl/TRDRNA2_/TRDRNA2_174216_c2_seq1:162-1283(+)
MEEHPWSIFFFMGVYFTVVLGMSNLVLAVIVDKALLAHQEDVRRDAQEREDEKTNAVLKFADLCEKLDEDASGCLSLPELLAGFDADGEFRDNLHVMDISRDDLSHLFKIMDHEAAGDISYQDFAMHLGAMRIQKPETQICFIKHWTHDIKEHVEKIERDVDVLKKDGKNGVAPDSTKLAEANEGSQTSLAPESSKPAGADIDVMFEAVSSLRLAMKEQLDEMLAKNERWSTELAARLQAITSGALRKDVDETHSDLTAPNMLTHKQDAMPVAADQVRVSLDTAPDASEDLPQIAEEERSRFPLLAEDVIPEDAKPSAPSHCDVKPHSDKLAPREQTKEPTEEQTKEPTEEQTKEQTEGQREEQLGAELPIED